METSGERLNSAEETKGLQRSKNQQSPDRENGARGEQQSRKILILVVYFSMFLDNILLTIVVPIIPDYLYNLKELELNPNMGSVPPTIMNEPSLQTESKDSKRYTESMDPWPTYSNILKRMNTLEYNTTSDEESPTLEQVIGNSSITAGILIRRDFVGENARVAILLSSKAVVQLVVNPVVGILMSRTGHQIPLFIGSLNLLLSSLLFAFASQYMWMLAARSLQGIASACFGVAGMCLVAERCPEEGGSRGKIMGIVLGATALGVLLGYPLGGLLYDFTGGKMVPFMIVAALVFLNTVIQGVFLNLKPIQKEPVLSEASKHVPSLLKDWKVIITVGAIWISTTAMSILEPCLPIWLLDTIKPERWQIGMVFIPDSLGYLLGTNFLGGFAFSVGRWRVAISAMILIGISTIMLASSTNMAQLIGPHFGIGLGIGAVDSALVPFLALLVERNIQNRNSDSSPQTSKSFYTAQYASVYALQQTAVSLAYSLGPFIGGELVSLVGFPWLIRVVGIINLIYSPLLFNLRHEKTSSPSEKQQNEESREAQNILMSHTTHSNYQSNTDAAKSWMPIKLKFSTYQRFYDSDDSD